MKSKSIIIILLFNFFFVLELLLIKYTLNKGANAFIFAGISIFTAGCILLPIFLYKLNSAKIVLTKLQIRDLIIIGLLASGIGIAIRLIGISYTTISNTGFLMASIPFFTIIFARIILKARIRVVFYFILLLMVSGIFLISTKGASLKLNPGDLIILLVSAIFGFTNVYAKKLMKELPNILVSSGRLVVGGIFLIVANLLYNHQNFYIFANFYYLFMAVGIIISLRVFFLYWAFDIEGVEMGAAMALISYPFVAIGGYLFLGETMGIIQVIGAVLIMLGAGLLTKLEDIYHRV